MILTTKFRSLYGQNRKTRCSRSAGRALSVTGHSLSDYLVQEFNVTRATRVTYTFIGALDRQGMVGDAPVNETIWRYAA